MWIRVLEKAGLAEAGVHIINGDGWQDARDITRFVSLLRRIGVHSFPYLAVFDSDGQPAEREQALLSSGLQLGEFRVLQEKELESYLLVPSAIAAVTGRTSVEVESFVAQTKSQGKEKWREVVRKAGIASADRGIMEAIVQNMNELPAEFLDVANAIKAGLSASTVTGSK